MTSHDCNSYRDDALEQLMLRQVDDHGCAECAVWLQRTRQQSGVLSSLERLIAPDELEVRIDTGLGEFPRRFAAACDELEALRAPSALDTLVAARIASADADELPKVVLPKVVQALADLSQMDAPHVLDRLVGEELEQGSNAGVVRSVRELERMGAPSALDHSPVGDADAAQRSELRSGILGLLRLSKPLGLVAAAALFVMTGFSSSWFGTTSNGVAPASWETRWEAGEQTGFEERLAARTEAFQGRSFESLRVRAASELGGVERQMVLGLGSALSPIKPALPLKPKQLKPAPLSEAKASTDSTEGGRHR